MTRAAKEFLADLVADPDVQDAIRERLLEGDTVAFFKAVEMVHGKPRQSLEMNRSQEWVKSHVTTSKAKFEAAYLEKLEELASAPEFLRLFRAVVLDAYQTRQADSRHQGVELDRRLAQLDKRPRCGGTVELRRVPRAQPGQVGRRPDPSRKLASRRFWFQVESPGTASDLERSQAGCFSVVWPRIRATEWSWLLR
jgi:hypothetical protein